MTANAPLKDGPDPCISVHTTLQADSQAKQIETEINHPITHGASFSPSYVDGILQTQIEAESAVQLTENRSNYRPVDKAEEIGIDDLPLIQAGKQDHPPFLQAHEQDVIRSRCDKAADSGLDNDDEMKHPDDDDGLPTKHPKDDDGISTNSEDEDFDEVQKTEDSEQVCATTMLAFAVPKQPSTDPMEIFTQRMEEMQCSFTQQMQDLAGQLHSGKKKLKPQKNSRQALGVSTIDIVGTSLATPPRPPLSCWGL